MAKKGGATTSTIDGQSNKFRKTYNLPMFGMPGSNPYSITMPTSMKSHLTEREVDVIDACFLRMQQISADGTIPPNLVIDVSRPESSSDALPRCGVVQSGAGKRKHQEETGC